MSENKKRARIEYSTKFSSLKKAHLALYASENTRIGYSRSVKKSTAFELLCDKRVSELESKVEKLERNKKKSFIKVINSPIVILLITASLGFLGSGLISSSSLSQDNSHNCDVFVSPNMTEASSKYHYFVISLN